MLHLQSMFRKALTYAIFTKLKRPCHLKSWQLLVIRSLCTPHIRAFQFFTLYLEQFDRNSPPVPVLIRRIPLQTHSLKIAFICTVVQKWADVVWFCAGWECCLRPSCLQCRLSSCSWFSTWRRWDLSFFFIVFHFMFDALPLLISMYTF